MTDLTLATDGDRIFNAHVAMPTTPLRPGILICTEMWGLTDHKRALADDYARRGFCAIAPNLFWRSTPSGIVGDDGPDRDIAWARLDAFDFHQAAHDMATAIAWLRAAPHCSGKIAALGFCMGGRLALLAALYSNADLAISLYALGIAQDLAVLQRASCPIQLHYGLADPHIPHSEIDAVRAASGGKPNIEIFTYPGAGHGFFNPDRAAFNADAVALATTRIDALLETIR